MRKLLIIFTVFFSISGPKSALAQDGPILVETLFGADFGPFDFEDNTGAKKSEYTSSNIGIHVGARVSARLGKILLGPTFMLSLSDMNLIKDFDSISQNNWSNQYYGVYLGAFLNDNFKINIEYYLSFKARMTWAQSKSSNYFSKGDEVKGTGIGAGISYAQGGFFYEVMYKIFKAENVNISNTKTNANSTKFSDPHIKTVSLSVGFIF